MDRLTRVCLILFVAIFSTKQPLKAQYYFPSYPDSVSWKVIEDFWGSGGTVVHQYTADTSFCGHTYSILENSNPNSIRPSYIRNSGGIVYSRDPFHNMNCSDSELVVYNYNLWVSDTFNIEFLDSQSGEYVVDSVYYKDIKGIRRKVLHLMPTSTSTVYISQTWTQGLGSSISPVYFRSGLGSASETYWYLACADSAFVPILRSSTCDTSYTLGIEDVRSLINLDIYPNPAHSYINIVSNADFINFSIYNHQGQKVQSGDFKTHIALDEIAPGLYLINFQGKNGLSIYRRIAVDR